MQTNKSNIETMPVVATQTVRQKLLNYIAMQEETDYEKVINESGVNKDEAVKIIEELIKEGEIYKSRPGYLKIV